MLGGRRITDPLPHMNKNQPQYIGGPKMIIDCNLKMKLVIESNSLITLDKPYDLNLDNCKILSQIFWPACDFKSASLRFLRLRMKTCKSLPPPGSWVAYAWWTSALRMKKSYLGYCNCVKEKGNYFSPPVKESNPVLTGHKVTRGQKIAIQIRNGIQSTTV